MQISMTPQKYAAAVAGLQAYKGGDLKSFEVDGQGGTIKTSQADLVFQYNGADTLFVDVTEKHGLAKFASDATIQADLTDFLNEVGSGT